MPPKRIDTEASNDGVRFNILGSVPADNPEAGHVLAFALAEGFFILYPDGGFFGPFISKVLGLVDGSPAGDATVFDFVGGAGITIAGNQPSPSDPLALTFTSAGMNLLNVNTTPVGNVTTGEDNLITYTVPADTLQLDGQLLQFQMAGTFAASLNNKRVRVYFGSALLIDTGALAITLAGDWSINGYIVRTGDNSQRCVTTITTNETALVATTDYVDATADLTGTVVLKATGEATATDDVIQKLQVVMKGG